MGPTQTDTIPGCQEFYTVADGDGCDTIEERFSITFSQFYAWNPSGKIIDSGLVTYPRTSTFKANGIP